MANEPLVRLKTKEEREADIKEEMWWLLSERGRLIIEYKQKLKAIDDKYDELDWKLRSGNF